LDAHTDTHSDSEIDREAALEAGPWKRNLIVCVYGSFTTIVGMTLLLPFLPLYVEQLGVSDYAAIVQWSGVAYGAAFFSAALTAPLWGRLADRYGRKLMLIRASLGMAVAMSLIGMAHNVYELVGLRLLTGLLGASSALADHLVAYPADWRVLVGTHQPSSVPPGPVVGQAWRYLKELRLDRGPLSHDEAEAELFKWAREQGHIA